MKPTLPAVLIVDLEVDPRTDTVFKIGAYRPDLEQGFERTTGSLKSFQAALGIGAAGAGRPLADGAQYS